MICASVVRLCERAPCPCTTSKRRRAMPAASLVHGRRQRPQDRRYFLTSRRHRPKFVPMAIVNTGPWVSGGPLSPNQSVQWLLNVPQGRMRWYIAYNTNNPGLVHILETSVFTRRTAGGQHQVGVTLKNIGTEPGFYTIYYAEAI
jgi:hypothetical protein